MTRPPVLTVQAGKQARGFTASTGPAVRPHLAASPGWPPLLVVTAWGVVMAVTAYTAPVVDGALLTEAGDVLTLENGDLLTLTANSGAASTAVVGTAIVGTSTITA